MLKLNQIEYNQTIDMLQELKKKYKSYLNCA